MNENVPKEPGEPRQVNIQIKVDDAIASGVYCNMAMVHHTDAEFTLDFVHVQPQAPHAKVVSRVITSPRHLKRLILALQDNLARYEATHGAVDIAPPPPPGQFRH